jgi:hypothetical protein
MRRVYLAARARTRAEIVSTMVIVEVFEEVPATVGMLWVKLKASMFSVRCLVVFFGGLSVSSGAGLGTLPESSRQRLFVG